MNIKIKINLDRLAPSEVIELYHQGVITLDEIRESDRARTCFGDELADFLWSEGKHSTQDTILNKE